MGKGGIFKSKGYFFSHIRPPPFKMWILLILLRRDVGGERERERDGTLFEEWSHAWRIKSLYGSGLHEEYSPCLDSGPSYYHNYLALL